MIFFNIPESWRGDDNSKQLVNNVCADICPELKDDLEVAEYTRLGKNKPAKITDKPRPVKVTLKSEAPKKVILSRAKALKTHHHSGFQKVVIVPDKTLAERERDKALYLELKKQKSAGLDVVIKRGEIVPRNSPPQPNNFSKGGAWQSGFGGQQSGAPPPAGPELDPFGWPILSDAEDEGQN